MRHPSIELLGDGIEPLIALNSGPVLSSKTELALYFARRYLDRGFKCVMVKPSWDTRYGDPAIVKSRSIIIPELPDLPVIVVPRGQEHTIPDLVKDYDIVFIDEGQAFKPVLAFYARQMFLRGQRVIINALDFTWQLQHFATAAAIVLIPGILHFRKHGFCLLDTDGRKCKRSAPLSQKLWPDGTPVRLFSNEPVDDPGDESKYLPRCEEHWFRTTPGVEEEIARGPLCRFLTVDATTNWEGA